MKPEQARKSSMGLIMWRPCNRGLTWIRWSILFPPHRELKSFLDHIEEARRVKKSSAKGKVNLMTIHQAKGLEFKCAIVPGLKERLIKNTGMTVLTFYHKLRGNKIL
jgi:superfamily I DNA/RNA helicase